MDVLGDPGEPPQLTECSDSAFAGAAYPQTGSTMVLGVFLDGC